MSPPSQSPPSQSLSCFPFYKVTGYMTNPHWMGSHMNTRLPQQFIKLPDNLQIHVYTPGWEEEMWRWSVINPHWMGSHTNTRLPQQFIKPPWPSTDTHIYSWVGRGNAKVKCIAQEHNTMTQPGLEPRPLNPDPSAPTIHPPHLPLQSG